MWFVVEIDDNLMSHLRNNKFKKMVFEYLVLPLGA
jgi:hypothetical protein